MASDCKTNISKDEYDAEVQLRRVVATKLLAVTEKLSEPISVDVESLNSFAPFLRAQEYEDITEERQLLGRCGSPVCSNTVQPPSADVSNFFVNKLLSPSPLQPHFFSPISLC